MTYDDDPRRRVTYPSWSMDQPAPPPVKQNPPPRRRRRPAVSRTQHDLILRLARQHPGWTARDIHLWIRHEVGRNDVSLKVIKLVLSKG
ncbi:hypothetical protein [Micromonospora chalcea]|uniref:hypothetical protein n=1 Tax=Micromonospora chalcea TaxID=1874 RepID=UPI000CE2FF3E|nr:hypothetical protein [Micromonospora chalcea]